jgi:hypothetical protein
MTYFSRKEKKEKIEAGNSHATLLMIGKKDDKTCNKDRNSTKLQREHAVAFAAEDVAVAHGE